MDTYKKYDKVKFYPKTNQPEARQLVNKQRMGRQRNIRTVAKDFTQKSQATPHGSPGRATESIQQRKNIALEVSPASERSINFRGSLPSSQLSRGPDIVAEQ